MARGPIGENESQAYDRTPMNRKPTPEELLKQMFSEENLKAFAAFFGEDFQPAKPQPKNQAKPPKSAKPTA